MTATQVLVIGRTGQIASSLAALSQNSGLNYRFVGRDETDLTSSMSIESAVVSTAPQLVINAAAYTAVDQAETERDLAYAVNAEGPRRLADICRILGIPLLQLSTDYVFDGRKHTPYRPDDITCPINVYGASKLAGEDAVRERLDEHIILRLAWVYSDTGRNFVNTMLRLATTTPILRVVDDQTGQPSYALDIAQVLDQIAQFLIDKPVKDIWGTYHLTGPTATTWFEFAQAIFEIAGRSGHSTPQLVPIQTSDYPTAARRPLYSVLDSSRTQERFGVSMPDWRDGLERCMAAIFGNTRMQKKG